MAFTTYEYKGLRWSASDKIGVKHLFTEKLGGVGDRPYSSVYDPEWLQTETQQRVRQIWLTLCEGAELPAGLCFTRQIHSDIVRTVGSDEMVLPPLPTLPVDCDGLCTAEKGVPLAVFGADCLPVLLCEEEAGVIAALHCGWKGTVGKIAAGMADVMEEEYHCDRRQIRAVIGPSISQDAYEVDLPVLERFREAFAFADAIIAPVDENHGRVDLWEANRRQLLEAGLLPEHIEVSGLCTFQNHETFFSHRAGGGTTGRNAAMLMLV